MIYNNKHIAIIPARKGSKGLPFKNRFLFDYTADFVDKETWFERVIVSTNDEEITKKALERNYDIHYRTEKLAGDAVSIKQVFRAIISDMKISNEDVAWLFYLPIVYRKASDFQKARQIIEKDHVASLCGFIPAKTHPYNCWFYDEKEKMLNRCIGNDVFRRQDLPPAWMHHHYVCCFKVGELDGLNSELINNKTYPFFLDGDTVENLIEIDTPEDYERWSKR